VLGRSYTDFTYQNDIGMVVPEGEEGIGPGGAAAIPPPMQAVANDAAVAAVNGVEINALMESLEALNLVSVPPTSYRFCVVLYLVAYVVLIVIVPFSCRRSTILAINAIRK
jgi:hypothetical protein